MSRSLQVLAIAILAILPGCSSCRKTDEEILKERIDTTSVHLYLASKFAILRADDPAAKGARDALLATLGSAKKADGPKPSLGDFAALAKDLFHMREEGRRILHSGEDTKPFLPVLLHEPAVEKLVDANSEHGLLLVGLFMVKFHPSSPAPIPAPVLLYESWMTHPEKIQLEGVAPILHSIKAIVYGGNELCDLAAREAKLAGDAPPAHALAATTKALLGKGLDDKQADQATIAARGIAHGMAGVCYMGRGDEKAAAAELEAFCDDAEKLGTPPEELALVRAYVALVHGDADAAKKHVATAKAHAKTPKEREELEDIEKKLSSDPKLLAKHFGKGRLALFAVKLGYDRLEAAGVIDLVAKSELGKVVGSFGHVTSGIMKGAEALPSWDGAKEASAKSAKSLWERVTGK